MKKKNFIFEFFQLIMVAWLKWDQKSIVEKNHFFILLLESFPSFDKTLNEVYRQYNY